MRLFAEKGFRETTVGEIEAAVGLEPRRGALYRHFPSKEALLEEALAQHLATLADAGTYPDESPVGDVRSEALAVGRWLLAELDRERVIVRILEQNRIATRGVRVTVVGNSSGIARPLVTLFEERGNDVTHVDADDAHLAVVTQTADILASAVERPGVISGVHVKPGATVVDAGYNRTARGVVGDLDLGSVERVAGAVLPMPGGIGPVTIAILLERTWDAARGQDTRAGVS